MSGPHDQSPVLPQDRSPTRGPLASVPVRWILCAAALLLVGLTVTPVGVLTTRPSNVAIACFRGADTDPVESDVGEQIVQWRWTRPPCRSWIISGWPSGPPPAEAPAVRLSRWAAAMIPAAAGLVLAAGAFCRGRWRGLLLLLVGASLAGAGVWTGACSQPAWWWWGGAYFEQVLPWNYWLWSEGPASALLLALAAGGHWGARSCGDRTVRRLGSLLFAFPYLVSALLLLANRLIDGQWPFGQETVPIFVAGNAWPAGLHTCVLLLARAGEFGIAALALANVWAGNRKVATAGWICSLVALSAALLIEGLSCVFIRAATSGDAADVFLRSALPGSLLHGTLPTFLGFVLLACGYGLLCRSLSSSAAQAGIPESDPLPRSSPVVVARRDA